MKKKLDWADKEALKTLRAIEKIADARDARRIWPYDILKGVAVTLRKIRAKTFEDAASFLEIKLLDGEPANIIRKEAAERLRYVIRETEVLRKKI